MGIPNSAVLSDSFTFLKKVLGNTFKGLKVHFHFSVIEKTLKSSIAQG